MLPSETPGTIQAQARGGGTEHNETRKELKVLGVIVHQTLELVTLGSGSMGPSAEPEVKPKSRAGLGASCRRVRVRASRHCPQPTCPAWHLTSLSAKSTSPVVLVVHRSSYWAGNEAALRARSTPWPRAQCQHIMPSWHCPWGLTHERRWQGWGERVPGRRGIGIKLKQSPVGQRAFEALLSRQRN